MFPKKKLASITITDLNCIKKTLDLEANKRKVWLKANAKFQIVNHKRYLIVDFCGVQDGTAAVILKGLYSKDDYWYYYPDLDRFSHKMLDEHLWNMGAEVDRYADLKTKKNCETFFGEKGLPYSITEFEYRCREKKREIHRQRILQKEKNLEATLLPLPKDALKFNHKMAPHFLIREPDKYTCTCCGKETEIPKKVKPFRHLAQTTCPKCGAPVTVQLRTIMKQFLDTISWTTVLQKTTDGGYVMRYLLFDRTYSKERGMTFQCNKEVARMWIMPDGTIHYSELRGKDWEPSTRDYFTEMFMGIPKRYFCGYSHLYPKGVADALSDLPGCAYYTDDLFKDVGRYNTKWYYMLWDFLKDNEGKRAATYEKLLQAGYHQMVVDLMMSYKQEVPFGYESLEKLFGFDHPTFLRWSKAPTLEHYCFLKAMPKMSDKEYRIYTGTFGFDSSRYRYLNGESICKVISYLKKQVKYYIANGRFNKKRPVQELIGYMLTQWAHYLYLMRKLYGEELNEQMLFPKEFYAADEMATKEMERREEEQRLLRDQTYRETIEKISAALRNDKDIQKFMDGCEGLKVFVPETPDELRREGARMGNCLGTYVDKVANGNTSIFFIRKINAPDKEYFAMEYNDGKIVQLHGKGNCTDQTGKVTAFADAFANVLRLIHWQPAKFVAA